VTADLVEYLRARIAEDEAAAWAATEGTWHRWDDLDGQGGFITIGDANGVIPDGYVSTPDDAECNPVAKVYCEEDADHLVRWGPARVLAECAAKRRVVERYETHDRALNRALPPVGDEAYRGAAGYRHGEALLILLALAQPYAARPDFNPAWRMEAGLD
jgi:hypothetical protein